jgi:hypothetical protein
MTFNRHEQTFQVQFQVHCTFVDEDFLLKHFFQILYIVIKLCLLIHIYWNIY